MANVSEFPSRLKSKARKRRSADDGPGRREAPFKKVVAEHSEALSALLAQRVRLTVDGAIRWVSGYEILSTELRRRAVAGENDAAKLLERLKTFQDRIPSSPALRLNATAQTPAEEDLSRAFASRSLESAAPRTDASGPRPGRISPFAPRKRAARETVRPDVSGGENGAR